MEADGKVIFSKGDNFIGIKLFKLNLDKTTYILHMNLKPLQVNTSWSKWFVSLSVSIFKFKLSVGAGV